MNTPQKLQDLVSVLVHVYPSAQIELDPLPSGVCFLWTTLAGHNCVLEYHPTQGTGVSENTNETPLFAGHENVFATLDEGIDFYKQLLAKASQSGSANGPYSRTAYSPVFDLKSN